MDKNNTCLAFSCVLFLTIFLHQKDEKRFEKGFTLPNFEIGEGKSQKLSQLLTQGS